MTKITSTDYHNNEYRIYIKQQNIINHLNNQIKLFDEINVMNDFWKNFSTISIFIYSSMYCFAMYIVLLTETQLEAKILSFVISFQPIVVIFIIILSSALIYDSVFNCNQFYYSILTPKLNNVQNINLRSHFKVFFKRIFSLI